MVFDPRQQAFTTQAQAALELSQRIVLQMRQNQWDTEHLLSGLLQVEGSLAAKILEELNVNVADLVEAIELKLKESPTVGGNAGPRLFQFEFGLNLAGIELMLTLTQRINELDSHARNLTIEIVKLREGQSKLPG